MIGSACAALNAPRAFNTTAALAPSDMLGDNNEGDLTLILLCFWLRIAAILAVAAAALLAVIAYRAKQQRELPLIIAGLALAAAGACFWMSLGLIADA